MNQIRLNDNINSIEQITYNIILFLNSSASKYALLGDQSKYPYIETDLDICVDKHEYFTVAFLKFCFENDIKVIKKSRHATGIRIDCGVVSQEGRILFHSGPDILVFPTWRVKGRVLEYFDLLKHREWDCRGFYAPRADHSFLFYLVKRIDKGDLGTRQQEYLAKLWQSDPLAIEKAISDLWSPGSCAALTDAAKTGRWEGVIARLPVLQREVRGKSKWSRKRISWIIRRTIERTMFPTGLCIAILGPDGCGKSSVITNIHRVWSAPFRSRECYHLRPHLGRTSNHHSEIVMDPHGQVLRGTFLSVVKILYWFVDYTAGYLMKVWPKRTRCGLVIFDRYYHDILVDPRRYRYGGPMELARLVGWLVPKPDFWILLDAPPEVLQARKQEVRFKETARQRQAYLELVKGMKNAVVVDAARPMEDVVAAANETILDFLDQRARARLGA